VVGALVVGGLVAGGLFFLTRPARPEQPIRFSHRAHTKDLTCQGCHQRVTEGAAAGMPGLSDCLGCHQDTQSSSAQGRREEAKIQAYARAKREIPWVRLTALAPHTFFSHRRHVELAKVACATCHGEIAQAVEPPRRPLVNLTMERCMNCHRQRQASLDCLACHR
jgi:hypothetical protein